MGLHAADGTARGRRRGELLGEVEMVETGKFIIYGSAWAYQTWRRRCHRGQLLASIGDVGEWTTPQTQRSDPGAHLYALQGDGSRSRSRAPRRLFVFGSKCSGYGVGVGNAKPALRTYRRWRQQGRIWQPPTLHCVTIRQQIVHTKRCNAVPFLWVVSKQ